jgi:hypothetical protein
MYGVFWFTFTVAEAPMAADPLPEVPAEGVGDECRPTPSKRKRRR